MSGRLESARARLGSFGVEPAEAAALLILLSSAVVLTVVVWLGSRPDPPEHSVQLEGAASVADPIDEANLARPPPATGTVITPSTPTVPHSVVIHVSGQVNEPGLVVLTDGDRVDDAVVAAGGPTDIADLSALNLARLVIDGEQIYLPTFGDETRPPQATLETSTSAGAGAPTPGDALVDLNRADAAALQTLPGVGPVMADRIVAHREEIGSFVDVTQLLEVTGIGPARLAELQRLVHIGP